MPPSPGGDRPPRTPPGGQGQAAPAAGRSADAAASAGPVPLPRSFAEALRRSSPATAAVDAAAADADDAAAAAADDRARVHPAQSAREGEVCRDLNFRRAGCRRVQCRYVHRLLPVCPAFQRGRCRDARCPNRHPRPGQVRFPVHPQYPNRSFHPKPTQQTAQTTAAPARRSQGVQAAGPFADDDLPEGPLLPQVLAARREVRRAQERAEELEAQLLREFNSWAPTPVEALCLVCGRLSTTAGEEAQHRARHRKDAVTQGRDSLVVAHVAVGDGGLRHMRELCLRWQAERPQAQPAQGGPQQGFPFAAPGPFGAPLQPVLQAGPAAPHPAPRGAEQGEEAAFEREAPACDRVLFGSASNRTASSPASPRDGSLPPPASRPRALSLPGDAGVPAGGADQVVPAASCGEGDPVGPAAPHRGAAPVAAGAARDVADQAGSPDAIEGADQVEPAGAPGGRAGGRAADAQTAERKLRRERRRFRHAADLAASGSSAVEPFPDSDESDSDGESESGSSGDVGGRGGGDDRDGGDGSGPGSGNVGLGAACRWRASRRATRAPNPANRRHPRRPASGTGLSQS
ncbi:hypothetical protein DIPPA_26305 [Diplonema papillatum]|nr:hypothetical protein DIPPA_26305 [Diplonema papillatum]